jgi:G:T/U-mismatch repair DNA glycosylase
LESIESHPFEPFLPEEAKVLMLGTFPAKPIRWSMDFYYPNFSNDMWRIMGAIFYGDRTHFEIRDGKKNRYDKLAIMDFCALAGIAISDTAQQIRRLKDNASDQFLEIVKPRNIEELLGKIPECKAIVTTGGKASEVIVCRYVLDSKDHSRKEIESALPPVGGSIQLVISDRPLCLYRMPSTSRAYPLAFEKKVEVYRKMFDDLRIETISY